MASYIEKLQELQKALGLAQYELAEMAMVDAGSLTRYFKGEAMPSELACIQFAGISPNEDQRQFWLRLRNSGRLLPLLARAAGNSRVDVSSFPKDQQKQIARIINFVLNAEQLRVETVLAGIEAWEKQQASKVSAAARRAGGK